MIKKVASVIMVVALIVITILVLINSEEITSFPELIYKMNRRYLVVAIICMLVYLSFNAIIIYIISKEISTEITFLNAIYITIVGQYYSLITPFASGGQPAQIYAMKSRYNIPISVGSTITIKKFIIYQLVISIYACIMFLIKLEFILENYSQLFILIIIGLISNLAGGILIILLFYSDYIVRKLINVIVNLITKIKIRKLNKILNKDKINQQVDDYVKNIDEIKKNKKVMILLILITCVQLTIYFSITYFIYLSLGERGTSYFDILAIQTVVYVVVSFIPTPGGAGASEGSFYLLFKVFFSKNIILYAMTLWRIIVYYGNMTMCGIILLLYRVFSKNNKHKIKSN